MIKTKYFIRILKITTKSFLVFIIFIIIIEYGNYFHVISENNSCVKTEKNL